MQITQTTVKDFPLYRVNPLTIPAGISLTVTASLRLELLEVLSEA